ncbi:sigma 54-interacting transcriptional regulator, partial [Bacillus sp. JJ722]|uniref:sigma 54-interacting transcriptional regulator n=1 Tax=Bacillus sp. JJ722 TaxID=3122973 RepID=UPI003000EEAC
MFSIAQEKIRPIISVHTEGLESIDNIDLTTMGEPFLFLMKANEIVSYVHIASLLLDRKSQNKVNGSLLIEYAHSIEGIGQLNQEQPLSLSTLFQIIGEPIAVIKESDRSIGYIRREELIAELFKQENESVDLLRNILKSIPMGIFVINKEQKIINCNDSGLRMIRSTSEKVLHHSADEFFSSENISKVFTTGKSILNDVQVKDEIGMIVDYSPIFNTDKKVEGIAIVVQDLPMVEQMAMEIEHINNLNKDLNAILSSIYDEILVVNHKGELMRYSDNIIASYWQTDIKNLIGKNIAELEEKGLFSPSVTRLVLEKKKKVSIVQETSSGNKILSVGNPVFNEKNELDRIIIASRDITEATRLKTELMEMKKISEQYKKELDDFKNEDRFVKKLVYRSDKMYKLINQARKISDFSSTVLIHGESGVGKEVIAQAIHQLGKRSSKKFLKLNCGAIPENLLESELFGYSSGSFTGADKNGKDGYFKQADEGIL